MYFVNLQMFKEHGGKLYFYFNYLMFCPASNFATPSKNFSEGAHARNLESSHDVSATVEAENWIILPGFNPERTM